MTTKIPKIGKIDLEKEPFGLMSSLTQDTLALKINQLVDRENARNEESAKEICGEYIGGIAGDKNCWCKNPKGECPEHDCKGKKEICGKVIPSYDGVGGIEPCQNPKGECPDHDEKVEHHCSDCGKKWFQPRDTKPSPTPKTKSEVMEKIIVDYEKIFQSILNTIDPMDNFLPNSSSQSLILICYRKFIPSILLEISSAIDAVLEGTRLDMKYEYGGVYGLAVAHQAEKIANALK